MEKGKNTISDPICLGLWVRSDRDLEPLYEAIAAIETATYHILPGDDWAIAYCHGYLVEFSESDRQFTEKFLDQKPIIALCDHKDIGQMALDWGAADYWLWSEIGVSLCERSLRLVLAARIYPRLPEIESNPIIANLKDGILIVDRRGYVKFANCAALRLFQRTAENLLGQELGLPLLTDNTTEIGITREDGSLGIGEISVAIAQWEGSLVYVVCARDITVRRQAEDTLRESEERFRQLANHLQAVFWLADFAQNQLVYVSPAFEFIWGRSIASITQLEDWLETVLPEDRPIILQARDRQQKGHDVEIEYRIVRPDGEIRWIGDRAFPIFDSRGQIIRAAGISEDITNRKQADFALRHSEERWRALFEQAAVGIFVVSLEGRFEQVNQKFCNLLGYTLAELMTLEYIEIVANDSEAAAQKRWQRLITGETMSYSVEKAYKTKKNGVSWVNLALSLVCDPDNNPSYVIGAVTDISDRFTAEQALHQQIYRERLLTKIAQNIHSSVDLDEILNLTVGDTRKLLKVDRALIFRLLPNHEGWVSHEATREGFASTLGMRFADEQFPQDCYYRYCQGEPRVIPDVEQDRMAACLIHYLRDLHVKSRLSVPIVVADKLWGLLIVHQCYQQRDWQSWEVDLLRQVGIQAAIAIQQTQLYDRLKNELHERDRVQTQLEQAKEMADAANRAKSEFLANMSHELRTPLNAILGFTQLLDRTTTQTWDDEAAVLPQQQEYIEIIKRSGEHLLTLINDILDLSKIEAGRVNFTPEGFDLWQMLDQIEEMFSFKAAQKGLTLQIERSPNLPQFIETDRKKLRSTLVNLLSNAVKFTETGYAILRASALTTAIEGTMVELSFAVEDTGIGIKSSELTAIFEAFRQSDTPTSLSHSLHDRTTEGTGLGLAISQHFVRLLGGEIAVRSQLHQGSVFQFQIPCRRLESIETTSTPVEQHAIAIAHQNQDYRIAIVEDDSTNCQLLMGLLEPLGFTTRSAVNGVEGVELWRAWHPHLILMDIRMPILDGYGAVKQIRHIEQQNPKRLPTSIIGLTASVFQTPQVYLNDLGFQDWIVKPFSEAELLRKIANCLHLNYEYAVQSHPKSKLTQPLLEHHIVKAEINTMSAQWRSQLRLAALSARSKQLRQLIAQLPPEKSEIIATLSYWIERLDFDRIIELIE
ncbi:MAG: PAS domain S-box protein [Jaaginema sp. PMC 1079.18]|nr:PAS domain S-box protein [Jaaginema sp. PMC 1080.18]MEC4851876.1 PAS domain S-box protein [Jaaginema sp. PMC 1079.18]MEC4868265.1 PAS domain S-box protein [Jaaginema sp. PMC 1078.18]